MVCSIDLSKSGVQTPECFVKQVRVLNQTFDKPDREPSEIEEFPVSDFEDVPKESAGSRNDQMCPIPSRDRTPENAEEIMIDCMMKSHEKEDIESSMADNNSGLRNRRQINRKQDTH